MLHSAWGDLLPQHSPPSLRGFSLDQLELLLLVRVEVRSCVEHRADGCELSVGGRAEGGEGGGGERRKTTMEQAGNNRLACAMKQHCVPIQNRLLKADSACRDPQFSPIKADK